MAVEFWTVTTVDRICTIPSVVYIEVPASDACRTTVVTVLVSGAVSSTELPSCSSEPSEVVHQRVACSVVGTAGAGGVERGALCKREMGAVLYQIVLDIERESS